MFEAHVRISFVNLFSATISSSVFNSNFLCSSACKCDVSLLLFPSRTWILILILNFNLLLAFAMLHPIACCLLNLSWIWNFLCVFLFRLALCVLGESCDEGYSDVALLLCCQVLHLLRRYLGEYVHGLSTEALRISVWKGLYSAIFSHFTHFVYFVWWIRAQVR